MRVIQIADGETTTGAKTTHYVVGTLRENYSVAIKGTGTFDVDFEGSFDGVNWVDLATAKNSDEMFSVLAVPYVRINCNTMTGASVSAWVGV